jgi:hypothetical protein
VELLYFQLLSIFFGVLCGSKKFVGLAFNGDDGVLVAIFEDIYPFFMKMFTTEKLNHADFHQNYRKSLGGGSKTE